MSEAVQFRASYDHEPILIVDDARQVPAVERMGWAVVVVRRDIHPAAFQQELGPLAEREAVYLWPGKEGDRGREAWERAIGERLPGVRILASSTVQQHPSPAEMLREIGEIGARARLAVARRTAIPVGTKPIDTPYEPLAGPGLDLLGQRLQAPVEAIPTFSPLWNDHCRMFGGRVGLARGWYVLIAGTAGFGKTYTACQIANTAMHDGESVAFHSLEMGWDELALRMLAQVSGEPIWKLEPGRSHDPAAYKRAVRYLNQLQEEKGSQMYVPLRPIKSLQNVLDSMRFHWEVYGVKLHVVDYLQLAWVGKAKGMTDQIIEVSHETRALTKDLRTVTVGLSQFNRETSANREDRPQKEGLLGGSALENDSDQTLLLDHSRVIRSEGGWRSWLLLDKNRNGPLVDVPVEFHSASLSIRERMDDEILESETQPRERRGRRKG